MHPTRRSAFGVGPFAHLELDLLGQRHEQDGCPGREQAANSRGGRVGLHLGWISWAAEGAGHAHRRPAAGTGDHGHSLGRGEGKALAGSSLDTPVSQLPSILGTCRVQGPPRASVQLCTQLQREVGHPEFLEVSCAFTLPLHGAGRRGLVLVLILDVCTRPHAAGRLTCIITFIHTAPFSPTRRCSQACPAGRSRGPGVQAAGHLGFTGAETGPEPGVASVPPTQHLLRACHPSNAEWKHS